MPSPLVSWHRAANLVGDLGRLGRGNAESNRRPATLQDFQRDFSADPDRLPDSPGQDEHVARRLRFTRETFVTVLLTHVLLVLRYSQNFAFGHRTDKAQSARGDRKFEVSPELSKICATCKLDRVDYPLAQMRKARGLSLEEVADKTGTDQANLSRIERGLQIPKRETARNLWRFYQGQVPVGAIYDPELYAEALNLADE